MLTTAERRGRRSKSATLFALLCLLGALPAAAEAYRDLTLEQALQRLKRAGLPLLYSSDLVKPWMRVREEPREADPRSILLDIVAPYGLTVREGPRGMLLLVRATQPSASDGTAASPRAPLEAPAHDLAEVIVTASHFELLREPELSLRSFSASDLHVMPDIGDDPLRAVLRLPGTSAGDFSAKAHVRGGEADESLIRFDGLRLFNPFHFKDFHSVFSTIDPGLIDGVRIYTGGFPAVFGDRMSSVIEIEPLAPKEAMHRELAISFFNASVLASDRFGGGDGDWLIAARRGHPDLILAAIDSQLGRPSYRDFHGRVRQRLTDSTTLAANFLLFDDDVSFTDSDSEESARADYRDQYYWLRLDHAPSPDLYGNALLAVSTLETTRRGSTDQPGVARGSLEDRRDFDIYSLQTDWSWRIGERLLGQFGGELRRSEGSYEYRDDAEFELLFVTPGAAGQASRTRELAARPKGNQYGLYANLRIAALERLTLDAGLRWDKETLSAFNENRLSPRLSLRRELGPRTQARVSWGRYFQGQAVNELAVSDGVTAFDRAQRSDHLIASIEHAFESGIDLRLEAYRKDYRELRPRFENLLNTLVLLPELKPDRVRIAPERAVAKGAELTVRRAGEQPLTWWASYTWSSVEDELAGLEAQRTWDQTNLLNAGLAWQTARWEASLAGTWHSGWPTTALQLSPGDPVPLALAGPRNAQRLRDYASLDGRIARKFRFEDGSRLTVFLELRNLSSRRNDCCTEYEIDDESGELELEAVSYPPIFPSLGFVWQF